MNIHRLQQTKFPSSAHQKLLQAFESIGWTQAKLHEESGVDRARISAFAHGRRVSMWVAGRLAISIASGMIENNKGVPNV